MPPTVSIASPSNGATFVEGETIPVTVAATDDLAVTGVTLLVNGAHRGNRHDRTVSVQRDGARTERPRVMLGAVAVDLGNNTGVAADVVVNVIPDPLTTAQGRVVMQDGTPLAGAAVSCVAHIRSRSATAASQPLGFQPCDQRLSAPP